MARPLPADVWTHWSVNLVRQSLLEHELGDFRNSAQLGDHIRRDPRIFATLDTRVLGALGLPFSTIPSDETDARREAEELMAQFAVLYPNDDVLRLALWGVAAYQLSWYDAHMWAYAEHFGLEELLSEDFDHGRLYGRVRIVNPFA